MSQGKGKSSNGSRASPAKAGSRIFALRIPTGLQSNVNKLVEDRIGHSVVFPTKLKKTFTTGGTVTLTGDGAGAAPVYSSLSLNSLFDPDYTGTGHSPLYYDTLLGPNANYAPYNLSTVVSGRLKAQFINTGASNISMGDVAVFVRSAATSVLDTSGELVESEHCKTAVIGSGYSDNGVVTIVFEVSRKMMGELQNFKDIEDCEDNVGQYNADPLSEILFDMYYLPYLASSTNPIYVKWTLEQDALLYQLNDITVSAPRPPRKANFRTHGKVSVDAAKAVTAQPAVVHPKGCFCVECKHEARGADK